MRAIIILSVCAVVVQFATDRIKALIPELFRAKSTPYIALVLGVVLSFSSGIGLFGSAGIALSPVAVDYVITGIAYSGGAVAFNEFIKLIRDMRQ